MGQGGAVLTNIGHVKKVLDSLRAWGRDCWCLPGHDNTCGKRFDCKVGNVEYDHKYMFSRLGYNMQITDLQAAIGLAQLAKIQEFEIARKRNWKTLREFFGNHKKNFILPKSLPGADPSWFGFHVTVKETAPFTRREITEYLESRKIGTRLLFGGNLLDQPAFAKVPHKIFGDLNNSSLITRGTFWLGVHPGIDEEKMSYVIDILKEFMGKYAKL